MDHLWTVLLCYLLTNASRANARQQLELRWLTTTNRYKHCTRYVVGSNPAPATKEKAPGEIRGPSSCVHTMAGHYPAHRPENLGQLRWLLI